MSVLICAIAYTIVVLMVLFGDYQIQKLKRKMEIKIKEKEFLENGIERLKKIINSTERGAGDDYPVIEPQNWK